MSNGYNRINSNSCDLIIKNANVVIPKVGVLRTNILIENGKIKELTNRLEAFASQSFKELSSEQSRAEVVVMFLAVLHLLRERLIQVEQSGQFSDILFKKPST